MLTRSCLRIGLAGSLLACNPAFAQTTAYALLTSDPGLAFAVDGQPQSASTVFPITGIASTEVLVAIDVRPQTGRLYGLAHDPKNGTVRLYHIDANGSTTLATAVGPAGQLANASGNPLPIFAQAFDIDFNPTVDRVRVVATNGLNFRMNPNNGALVDGDFGTPGTPSPGVNPDASLTLGGNGIGAMGTAYTNNAINVAVTTQYSLDHVSNALYIQNPPNAGVLTNALPLTVSGSPLDFGAVGSIDIEPGINVTTANAPATGLAAAALTVGGQSRLYRVDLATGAATLQGALNGLNVVAVAVYSLPPTVNTLSLDGQRLRRFALAAPATTAQANVTGVVAGERLVGIDMRPTTGQLYALGIDAANDRGTIYVLEPQSAAGAAVATPVGTPGSIAYVDAGGVPVDLSDLPMGIDFNPTVDRIRIVDASGLNARGNPITGAAVDGDTNVAGINPDGNVQGELGTQLVATAYTTSVPAAPFTTQYTLDQGFARLQIQNPPNAGTQTLPLALTISGAPFEFRGDTGFDIPPGVTSPSANAPVPGVGYFTANDPLDVPTLYELDLSDATVTSIGAIGSGAPSVTGLAVYNAPAAAGFIDAAVTVSENAGSVPVAIALLGGGSVPVHYRTVDGTAVAGQDYTASSGTVLLRGANPVVTIPIAILGDALTEPNETFTVVLSGPFPGPQTFTVTIQNGDDAIFRDGFENP